MNRVLVSLRNDSTCLRVVLNGSEVVVNPEQGKQVASVAARIAKKLRQVEACFVDADGRLVDGDCSRLRNEQVLKIGEFTLPVFVNPPTVIALSLPGYPMVGMPIIPKVTLEHTENAAWRWLLGEEIVGSERCYVPTVTDIGLQLCCECTPLPCGTPITATMEEVRPAPVRAVVPVAPTPCARGNFRALSWNLLAEYNLQQDLVRGDSACLALPPEVTNFYCRRQLLLREILSHGSDILCLQEVDRDKMFGDFLRGQLERSGFDGVYANKVHTSTPVGNAVFWCRQSWRLLSSEALDLTSGEDIQSLLEAAPSIAFAMSKTTTVANLLLLEHRNGRRLSVANLHLFGDPHAPHIRLLQAYLVLRAAVRHEAPLLLCGDFNCGPQAGVCELLTVGGIDEGHPDWMIGHGFEWGALCEKRIDSALVPEDKWCAAMSLTSPFALTSAGVPEYTYWNGASGYVVDHMFVDSACHIERLAPVPPLELIHEHGAPSVLFPSDHVAVVADLCWVAEDYK